MLYPGHVFLEMYLVQMLVDDLCGFVYQVFIPCSITCALIFLKTSQTNIHRPPRSRTRYMMLKCAYKSHFTNPWQSMCTRYLSQLAPCISNDARIAHHRCFPPKSGRPGAAVQRPDVPSGAEAGHWHRILHCRRALCILCVIEFVHEHQVVMCLPTCCFVFAPFENENSAPAIDVCASVPSLMFQKRVLPL